MALADGLASRFHSMEALAWYRKAAAHNNVEGQYHVGDMLLFGAPGIPYSEAVKPNQTAPSTVRGHYLPPASWSGIP